MNWKDAVISELRDHESKLAALEQIPARIKTLEMSFSAIRSAMTDSTPVSGGTNRREDAMLDNIYERDAQKANLAIVERQVRRIEKGLSELTQEERIVLDRFFIRRPRNYIDALCDELCCERTQVYRIKDRALRNLTMKLCGVVEL